MRKVSQFLSEKAHDLDGSKPKTLNVTANVVGTSIAPGKLEFGALRRLARNLRMWKLEKVK